MRCLIVFKTINRNKLECLKCWICIYNTFGQFSPKSNFTLFKLRLQSTYCVCIVSTICFFFEFLQFQFSLITDIELISVKPKPCFLSWWTALNFLTCTCTKVCLSRKNSFWILSHLSRLFVCYVCGLICLSMCLNLTTIIASRVRGN